jgi:mannose-1-phosphate guanylyltransferase
VLINTHHHAGQVRSYIDRVNRTRGLRAIEAYEPQLLGSAGTVHANRGWMDDADECLVIYADNLSSVDLGALLRFHASHSDPVTVMLFHAPEPRRSGIVQLDGRQRVVSFVEKPDEPRGDLANAGLYVLAADAYREIADLAAFDFGFEVLPRFVGRMRGWLSDCYHQDVGTLSALRAAEEAAPHVFGRCEEVRP